MTARPSAAVLLRQKLTAQISPAELARLEQQHAPNGKPTARSRVSLGGYVNAISTATIHAQKRAAAGPGDSAGAINIIRLAALVRNDKKAFASVCETAKKLKMASPKRAMPAPVKKSGNAALKNLMAKPKPVQFQASVIRDIYQIRQRAAKGQQ